MIRQLSHPGGDISYFLKLSVRRRTIGLRVDEKGLTVSAPDHMGNKMLEQMLLERSDWIISKLNQWQTMQEPEMTWQDGERLFFLGNEISLCLVKDRRNRKPELEAGRLLLLLKEPDDKLRVSKKVLQWFRQQALVDFSRRVELLAEKLGVAPSAVMLSNAKSRWGSCNGRGEIRLNWRLIQAPPHIIHYVVAHELAHLKHMNHSPDFWQRVATLCPDYVSARDQLKTLSCQLYRIG